MLTPANLRMTNIRPSAALRHWRPALTLTLLALVVVVAAQPAAVIGVQDDPVTLYRWTAVAAPNLDPQRIDEQASADMVENLFLGLTRYNDATGDVLPALAAEWEISADAQTFTFTLRDDVYWVHYDPDTQITARVRPVVAQDFVYAIERACTPDAGQTGELLAGTIAGCDALYSAPSDQLSDDMLVAARAPAADTLVINTQEPAPWFLSITPAIYPVPADAIERDGAAWTLAGNLVTNGPFVLTRAVPGQFVFERRNPHLPEDLADGGNVTRVIYDVVRDLDAGFSLYLEHKVDLSALPLAEVAGFVGQRPGEAVLAPDQRVGYLGFTTNRAPFNDVRVRRAFAAALDRDLFVEQVLGGAGLPVTHLAPAGVFGAPADDAGDLGYDPVYAQEQFADAGYAGCARFPYVTLIAHESSAAWVDFMVSAWNAVLGCDRSVFRVQLVDFTDLLARTGPDASYAEQPNLFALAWRGEYPDANNWVRDLLGCDQEPRTRRACSDVDDLLAQAAAASDTEQRRALYIEAEAALFSAEGEMPLVPLYQRAAWTAVKPWVDALPPLSESGLVGMRWGAVTIDTALQARCRSKDGADLEECTAPMVTLPQPATMTPAPTRVVDFFGDALGQPTPTPTGEFDGIVIPVTPTPSD
jgi:ABC-type oligopeptide transport system substrate-binding subunit